MPILQRGLAAAIALGLLAAGPTHAAERVSYRDLDLSTPRDAEIMAGRIRRAAVAACEATHANLGQDFEAIERFEACRRQAIADATRRLAAPRVSTALKLRHRLVVEARR